METDLPFLQKKAEDFFSFFNEAKTKEELLKLKAEFLGESGPIIPLMELVKKAPKEQKGTLGPLANTLRSKGLESFQKKWDFFLEQEILDSLKKNSLDLTARESFSALDKNLGGLHPRTVVQREVEDIFTRLGFDILEGPHLEDDYHNFSALNIPEDHPAREMQDTFWLEGTPPLLRTHTSTIQVRGMKQHKPPFRFIGPGPVFRCERTDASHESVFYQLEGMYVDKNVSVAHLIYFMKVALKEILKREAPIRLRPGYFPFTEPSFELEIECALCKGKGCSVCKQLGWVELLPCGMIHPNVLRAGGIDPDVFSGFAFGLGLDRLVMMRFKIEDIRLLQAGDLRFSYQFAGRSL